MYYIMVWSMLGNIKCEIKKSATRSILGGLPIGIVCCGLELKPLLVRCRQDAVRLDNLAHSFYADPFYNAFFNKIMA